MAKQKVPEFEKRIREEGPGTHAYDPENYSGLYFRTSPKGKITWIHRYTRPGTTQGAQPKLGEYGSDKDGKMQIADAVSKWREWNKLLNQGVDPQLLERQQKQAAADKQAESRQVAASDGLTVDKLKKDYVGYISRTGGLKSWKSVGSKLDAALEPYFSMPATEFARPHAKAVLKPIRLAGKNYQHNRTLAAGSSMYSWAIRHDWPYQDSADDDKVGVITANPFQNIDKMAEKPRDHTLTKAELKRLFKYLSKTSMTPDQQDVLLFTLYTGCRIGEACQVEWADIHGDDEWIQPASKTKNERQHIVYLTQPVLDIIERHKGGRYVFSSKTTDSGHIRLDGVEKQLRLSMDKLKVRPHRLHDYRRTFGSWMGDSGIDETVHDRVLNHVITTGVRKTYNTAKYNQPAREAWQAWANYLQELQP